MPKTKNFLEDIVERTFKNLDIAILAAGTTLLFPTAATIATVVGGAYLVADAVGSYYTKKEDYNPNKLKKLQEEIDGYLDKYKLELGIRLREYGFNYDEIKNYLDGIIRKEEIIDYFRAKPKYA